MKMSGKENVLYSIGGVILIVMIFSGWKGMLAAALILGWLSIAARWDGAQQKEEEVPERVQKQRAPEILSFEAGSARIRAQRRKAS